MAMVVALLVERLLPTADVRISNPAISKKSIKTFTAVKCIAKTKIRKKRPGMSHCKKVYFLL